MRRIQLSKRNYIQLASVLVLLGIVLIVGAWQLSTLNENKTSLPADVVELIPGKNDSGLRNLTVGIELDGAKRYNIELSLDGNRIFNCPEGLFEDCGAIKTDFRLTYMTQDEESTIGLHCAVATYSLVSRPGDETRVSWCFDVTA